MAMHEIDERIFAYNKSIRDSLGFRKRRWTGSNRNPNNNAGEGPRGTDRSNVVLLNDPQYDEGKPDSIIPTKYGQFGTNYPAHLESCVVTKLKFDRPAQEKLATSLIRAYFDLAPRKATTTGTFFYMSTRNNNFSNRDQKGKVVVRAKEAAGDTGLPTNKSINESPVKRSFNDISVEGSSDIIGAAAQQSSGTLGPSYPKIGTSSNGSSDNDHWEGRYVKLPDGVQGISVQEDTVPIVKEITVQEWSRQQGEDFIKSQGGEMNKGDDYASKFMVILPMIKLTEDLTKFEVKMKADPGSKLYHSTDTQSWHEVDDVFMDETSGMASFDACEGGLYVARSEEAEEKRDSTVESEWFGVKA